MAYRRVVSYSTTGSINQKPDKATCSLWALDEKLIDLQQSRVDGKYSPKLKYA